jgi:hypothetical protein
MSLAKGVEGVSSSELTVNGGEAKLAEDGLEVGMLADGIEDENTFSGCQDMFAVQASRLHRGKPPDDEHPPD